MATLLIDVWWRRPVMACDVNDKRSDAQTDTTGRKVHLITRHPHIEITLCGCGLGGAGWDCRQAKHRRRAARYIPRTAALWRRRAGWVPGPDALSRTALPPDGVKSRIRALTPSGGSGVRGQGNTAPRRKESVVSVRATTRRLTAASTPGTRTLTVTRATTSRLTATNRGVGVVAMYADTDTRDGRGERDGRAVDQMYAQLPHTFATHLIATRPHSKTRSDAPHRAAHRRWHT